MDINYATLEYATLEQGKIYKRLQQKIIEGETTTNDKISKGRLARKEGMQNNSVSQQSFDTLNDNLLTKEQMLKYRKLQAKFNDLLSQYRLSQKTLMSETSSKLSLKSGKNVYVNTLINNPSANYLGPYKSSIDDGPRTFTYDDCLKAATSSASNYFGLANIDMNTNLAECKLEMNLDAARKNGRATNGCSIGSDGRNYGDFNSNTTAIYSTGDMSYNGCYKSSDKSSDSDKKSMESSGINIENYTPVYTLGPIGMGPWGNSGGFPDESAQWIWYASGAQNDAPVNSSAPITFIYGYNYTGTTYITATVNAMNDDSGIWYLNSNQIGTVSGGWGTPGVTFNVTLAPGMNYLQCSAINTGGPAGLVATVRYNGQVLFNTNGDWKYTNTPVSNMIINATNYSVPTCQQYANKNGYQYFGLQNGSTNTSQCVVSNSLTTATEYGSSDPTVTLSDEHSYGIKGVSALYKLNNQGSDPASIGKVGYVDNSLQVSEYPASMIESNGVINSNVTCPHNVEPIDSVAWGKLKNSGKKMSPDTKCGLAAAITDSNEKTNLIKGELAEVADQMLSIISNLQRNNQNINDQMNIDEKTMLQNLDLYKGISSQFKKYKNYLNNNIVSESGDLVNYENYHYIFWGVLALSIVIITLNTLNRK